MVLDPVVRLTARDQQQPLDAGQGRVESVRAGVVGLAHQHATIGEVRHLPADAHDGDDLGGRHSVRQEVVDGETPQLA